MSPSVDRPAIPSMVAPGNPSMSPQPPVAVPARPTADLFGTPPEANLFDALRALPARFDLTPGLPDLTAFPRAAWLRAERAVLGSLPSADFGYGDPRGAPALRRAIADWLARNRGVRADPDEVLIVSGTAQTLTLLGRVLRDAGITAVAVEDPGALGARQHLAAQGLDTPPVPVDAEGVSVDALRATGAPAVLLTPAHQFPMGVVLGGVRRRQLIRWATESGGLIMEDDYDAEHRYDRPPVPALRAMLPGHVCYAGSVSKLLAPALRIGWVLAPPPYGDALIAAKRLADLGNAVLPQLVLAHLMESGDLERQLRLLRTRHRRRRDTMAAAIKDHLPGATLHGAAAGLHRRSPSTRRPSPTPSSPPRPSPGASRRTPCPGTPSAPPLPAWCSATRRAPRPTSPPRWRPSARPSARSPGGGPAGRPGKAAAPRLLDAQQAGGRGRDVLTGGATRRSRTRRW